MTTPYIQALLVERAGYIARNLPKRVASVDEALREVGYDSKYLAPKEVASVTHPVETASEPMVKRKRVADNGDN